MSDPMVELPAEQVPAAAEAHREFMHVGRLVPTGQEVVSVSPGESVGRALQLMRDHDFSQLPAVHQGRVIGTFTWRAFANGAHTVPAPGADPLATPVEDWLEDLQYVRVREELSLVLPALTADGAVLLGDEDQLVGIVTLADLAAYLWAATEPFVLLQDVELAVRDLLRVACPSEAVLAECIRASGARARPGVGAASVGPDDLTFGGLLHVLKHEDSYRRYFSTAFGDNPSVPLERLQPLNEFRNRTFHFSGELHHEEYRILVGTRRWLQRKLDSRRTSSA